MRATLRLQAPTEAETRVSPAARASLSAQAELPPSKWLWGLVRRRSRAAPRSVAPKPRAPPGSVGARPRVAASHAYPVGEPSLATWWSLRGLQPELARLGHEAAQMREPHRPAPCPAATRSRSAAPPPWPLRPPGRTGTPGRAPLARAPAPAPARGPPRAEGGASADRRIRVDRQLAESRDGRRARLPPRPP